MFARFRQNPNLRKLFFQEAFFGGFSPWLLAGMLLLAVVFPTFWVWLVAAGAVLWLINFLAQLNSEATYRKAVSFQMTQGFSGGTASTAFNATEIEASLDGLLQSIRGKVQPDVLTKVQSIAATIHEILPYGTKIDAGSQDTFTVRQAVLEYLPDTLESYLKLSPRLAEQKVLKDGKTAQALLNEQLELLNVSLKDILDSYHRNDTEQLLVQGRFLRDKFQKSKIF
jgi:hypothetical protein